MAIKNIKRFADAIATEGATWQSWFHKTGGPTTNATGSNVAWIDMSMGAGQPKYNAYVGSQATATPLVGAGNDGIYLGPQPPSGQSRYISTVMIQPGSTPTNQCILLCDYLMHYPLVDCDNVDQQDMDNTLTLPRYTTGEGVRAFIVATTPTSLNVNATISYTNSSGVSGKISSSSLIAAPSVGQLASSSNTSSATNSRSPFIPLANGDTGIRSIESITLSGSAGGFAAIVLVKPIMNIQTIDSAMPVEIQTILQKSSIAPKLENGAYLNFILATLSTASALPFRGMIETSWN